MPGVTKDGKPMASYGYDIGGQTASIGSAERGEKMPASGALGKLNKLNTDRFIERKPSGDDTKTYGKTGYESTAFTKAGCVKGNAVSDPKFLESDGSWAPAEGRGSTNTGTVMKRGPYSGAVKK